MKPTISIVISCYNDWEYISKAVDSAFNQTWTEKEIIIVDDGSDERTKNVLKNLEPKIDILITQENRGVSAARNCGISAANGKYILILDGDDYFEPSFCEKAINIVSKDSSVTLVTCYARWFDSKDIFQIFKPAGGFLKDYLKKSCALSNSVFRKKDWQHYGGYDEKMLNGWEDWEFFIRLHQNGGRTYVIPEVLFNYRKKRFSKTTKANKNKSSLLAYVYIKHSALYKKNLPLLIHSLTGRLHKEEKEKMKIKESFEYRLGKLILSPLRFLKRITSK